MAATQTPREFTQQLRSMTNPKRTPRGRGQGQQSTPRKIDYTSMSQKSPAARLTEDEYTKVLKLIGEKAFFKFKNVRDAFRTIDQDRSGTVDKFEMCGFFRQFALPDETAILLFDYLDQDGSGELDYVEFMQHFGPIIQPGVPPPITYKNPLAGDGACKHNDVAGLNLRKLG